MRDGKEVEGGLLVIRLFLAIVFGVAAVTGMAILVEHSSALWILFVGVMVLLMLGLSRLFFAAADQSLRILTRRPRHPIPVLPVSGKTGTDDPAPAAPSKIPTRIEQARSAFEEHLARVRRQREYWLQRLRERQGRRS